MPSFPIVEQIRGNLVAAVANVTVDNGYQQTLTVESVSRYGNSAGDLVAVIEQSDETVLGDTDENAAVGQDTYVQEFLVFIHIQNPAGAGDFDKKCNLAAADVRKAVLADTSRGGLAIWTHRMANRLFVNDSGEVAGIMVPFAILYRTTLDNPYTQ